MLTLFTFLSVKKAREIQKSAFPLGLFTLLKKRGKFEFEWFEVLLGTLKMKRRPCRIAVPIDRNIKEWHWWDMPYYKLGEEAIFCGYSLSQERVFCSSLARPTFQAVSPSIALPW